MKMLIKYRPIRKLWEKIMMKALIKLIYNKLRFHHLVVLDKLIKLQNKLSC